MSTTTTTHGLIKQTNGENVGAWDVDERTNLDELDARLPRAYAGDPNSNVEGKYVGQLIWDSVGKDQWHCTTTGNAATAVWELDGSLLASANLSDVASASTSLANLGGSATGHAHTVSDISDAGALASLNSVGAAQIDTGAVGASELAATAVTAGTYVAATLTVDADGRLTAASASGALSSVSQGDVNTSTGTVSSGSGSFAVGWWTIAVLPGGQYGFGLECKTATGAAFPAALSASSASYTHYASFYSLNTVVNTMTIQERYITSSPPFDLGDGETGGFIFLKVKAGSGEILGHYAADVPPWGYNGPTNIRADIIQDGKKYRKISLTTFEERMAGVEPQFGLEEITQEIKNRDMGLIPHPFGALTPGELVVLVDPMSPLLRTLIDVQNEGEDITDAIQAGKIKLDNEPLIGRGGPNGVPQHKFTWGA